MTTAIGITGMSRTTGKALSGLDHLWQSVADILSTPIGTRCMRRDYGSRLFELVDRPINDELIVEIYAAIAEALDRWEPRLKLSWIKVVGIAQGTVTVDLRGVYVPSGKEITLEGVAA